MLEYLYLAGELAVAGRNSQFEVLYDLPERVIPRHVLETADPVARGGGPRAGTPGRARRTGWRRSRACATTTG